MLDGADALSVRQNVGDVPMLHWRAPSIEGTKYRIALYRVDQTQSGVMVTQVATLRTEQPSAVLPPVSFPAIGS